MMYYVLKFSIFVFLCDSIVLFVRFSGDGPVMVLFLSSHSFGTIITYPHIRSERLFLIFEFLSYFCFGTLALLALILYLLYFKITGYILRIYKVM